MLGTYFQLTVCDGDGDRTYVLEAETKTIKSLWVEDIAHSIAFASPRPADEA